MKNITLSLVILLLLGANLTAQETKAVDLMSNALYEENISADYAKASLIYQQVLKDFSQDKKACGQATYRLGLCAEKLGQSKAEEYFIKVVENFSDQPELVNLARAKLNNSGGTKYFTDERDGKKYKYVTIGRQVWMAENLAYMPKVSPLNEQGGIWVYDYDGKNADQARLTENFNRYGCLYDWNTAKNVCPQGWHLPSQDEWTELDNFVGRNESYAFEDKQNFTDPEIFRKLIDPKIWELSWIYNATSFSAVPGGTRVKRPGKNFFYSEGMSGLYWTSSSVNPDKIWSRRIQQLTEQVLVEMAFPEDGYSVRCIRNELSIPDKEIVPKIKFWNSFASGMLLKDYEAIKFTIRDGQQINRVDFFVIHNSDTTLLGSSFTGEGGGRFYVGWNTKEFPDGKYELQIIARSFLGKNYVLSGDFNILNEVNSKVDGTFKDDRDGRKYNFVKIGSQVWMAENLNYAYKDGNGSWCQNSLPTNCDIYGRLYDNKTAQLVCPKGWHLPSIEEWDILANYISENRDKQNTSDTASVGYKLKSISGWNYSPKSKPGFGNGNNEYGFNALPGGWGSYENFGWQGAIATFWSSSNIGGSLTWMFELGWLDNKIQKTYDNSVDQFCSVRCIKDTPPTKN